METVLAPEIIIKIFQNLSPTNLKNVVLVCKKWQQLAEDPSLWTWCEITINSINDLKNLKLRRLNWIENIHLGNLHKVLLGDEKKEVSILGYDNLSCYDSCKECATKLIDNFCKKCNKKYKDQIVKDCYVSLYVQDVHNEENIMNIFAFKRVLNIEFQSQEEAEKALDELIGKNVIIEYDLPETEEGRYKLIKLHKG